MTGTPLLPREDAREAALFFVVVALCFLASLSGLVARSAYAAASTWTNEVTGQITVRVHGDDLDARRAVEVIETVDGIAEVHALTREESSDLLKPWLGASGVPDDLPLPQMIAATAKPGAEGLAPQLEEKLKAAGLEAQVDDHVAWSSDVKRATDSAGLAALIAVALLAATAVAVIAFATHATLLARREMVELLHLTGAKDSFIAGLFEQRFLMLGVQAGAVGALLALGAAAFILFVVKQADQRIWLLPQLSLSLADGLILGLAPLVAGLAAMLAAKATVHRSLGDMI
jgi:cell division transport system permease protein